MKLGLDTFELNGILDWTQVATRYSFGWIKATDGISSDILFLDNWSKASALCGAYHFFRPVSPGDWQYQDPAVYIHNCVSTFLQMLGGNLGAQPPMLDVEVTDSLTGDLVLARAKAWLEECQTRTGVTPAIYTRSSFWKEIGGDIHHAAQQRLGVGHPLRVREQACGPAAAQ
jgi:lysozyme